MERGRIQLKKRHKVTISVVTVLIITTSFWLVTGMIKNQNQPPHDSNLFVHHNNDSLSWIVLTNNRGNAAVEYHHDELVAEAGKEPFIQSEKQMWTGKTTRKGYDFSFKDENNSALYKAWFSNDLLVVQRTGDPDTQSYKLMSKEKHNELKNALEEKMQVAIYHAEANEKERLSTFFSELSRTYGYLHTNEKNSYQLLIKIDEALQEGELTATLFLFENKGNPADSTEEETFILNGISDGMMIEFFTTVEGKDMTLTGHFNEDTTSFDLSFWMNNDIVLTFQAVSEKEFKQRNKAFKVE